MFCQIWGPLKAIVLIPYFIVDLCLDASILGFLNCKGNHLFETLRSLFVEINHFKTCKLQWEEILNFLFVLSLAISRSSEKLEL